MSEYVHTLIPTRVDFIPQPEQVGAFLDALDKLGAVPLKSQITVARSTGKSDSVVNPFTGQAESFAVRKGVKVKSLAAVAKAIAAANDYNVLIAGQGPATTAPLKLKARGTYGYSLNVCARAAVVCTSDRHDDVADWPPTGVDADGGPFFDRPCDPKDRLGVFHHPETLEAIEVPKAGCARFWIEFELGHGLYPPMKDSLEFLDVAIVRAAEKAFGLKFVQGCHWCA
jgi:hypothetical protein